MGQVFLRVTRTMEPVFVSVMQTAGRVGEKATELGFDPNAKHPSSVAGVLLA
ncbi:hypothetical protein IWQ51_001519 [Labrenzia sp. EL_142]|nr:hypothetical protein [Labrenzia sp. EL_142]